MTQRAAHNNAKAEKAKAEEFIAQLLASVKEKEKSDED